MTLSRFRLEESRKPFEIVAAIDAINPAGAAATAVETERCNPAEDIAVADEVRPARVTETGSARGVVVGQQQREVAGEPGVYLVQLWVGDHSNAFCDLEYRIDLLESITDGGERHILLTALVGQLVELVQRGQRTEFGDSKSLGAGSFEDDDAKVEQEERVGVVLGMCVGLSADVAGERVSVAGDTTFYVCIEPYLSLGGWRFGAVTCSEEDSC